MYYGLGGEILFVFFFYKNIKVRKGEDLFVLLILFLG